MTEQEQNERFTLVVVRAERQLKHNYSVAGESFRADTVEKALRVYFRFRALHDLWLEGEIEPTAEAVLEALHQARIGE